MGLFPPVNGSRHLQRSPLLRRVINYISLLFSLTLPPLLPGSDKAGWMAFSSFLFLGCLFLKLVKEGTASLASPFPGELAGETTSAGTGRVPMTAPLNFSALSYQFTQVS